MALVVGAGRGRVVGRVGGGVVGGPRSQGPQVLAIVPGVSVAVSRSVPVLKVSLKFIFVVLTPSHPPPTPPPCEPRVSSYREYFPWSSYRGRRPRPPSPRPRPDSMPPRPRPPRWCLPLSPWRTTRCWPPRGPLLTPPTLTRCFLAASLDFLRMGVRSTALSSENRRPSSSPTRGWIS